MKLRVFLLPVKTTSDSTGSSSWTSATPAARRWCSSSRSTRTMSSARCSRERYTRSEMHSTHMSRRQQIRPGQRHLRRPIGQRAHERVLVHAERTAPSQRTEDGRMPDLGGGDVERLQLGAELLGVVDERQEIGERDELAVVEPAAHEARVVVTALLAVGDHVDAGPELRVDGQAYGVVGGGLEVGVAQPALHVLVHGREHPARPRPAADAHHGQRADGGGGRGRRQRGGNDHGDAGARQHGGRRRRPCGRRGRSSAQRALADEEAALAAGLGERHELVAGEPAPRGEIFLDGDLDRAELQQLAGDQRVEVLADQEQEPVAAIQIAAVEADVGGIRMALNGLHRGSSIANAGAAVGEELDQLGPADDRRRRPPGCSRRACAS